MLETSAEHRGDEDDYTHVVRVRHGRVLQQLDRVDEAEAELRAVLALGVRTLDAEHPFVAAIREGVARLSG